MMLFPGSWAIMTRISFSLSCSQQTGASETFACSIHWIKLSGWYRFLQERQMIWNAMQLSFCSSLLVIFYVMKMDIYLNTVRPLEASFCTVPHMTQRSRFYFSNTLSVLCVFEERGWLSFLWFFYILNLMCTKRIGLLNFEKMWEICTADCVKHRFLPSKIPWVKKKNTGFKMLATFL